METKRPDLTQVDSEVRAYIEALEAQLVRLSRGRERSREVEIPATILEPNEPPTTLNVVTISASGMAKRTPRHFYARQRRGGMGIFDLDVPEEDPPAFLTVVDESHGIVLVTNLARVFRLPMSELSESPVHSRGQSLAQRFTWRSDEQLAVAFPDRGASYLVLVTERGQVRRYRHHYFGENVRPGTLMYDIKEGGAPAATCWTNGDADLFIATRRGQAIRFEERQVPVRGILGIRVDPGDAAVAITPVTDQSGVFLLGADGKGTIRLMEGFSRNKVPGAGGKLAMKVDHLVGASAISPTDDIFGITRLSKIIRFSAVEVPDKEGVVQGVNCISLRADEVTAVTVSAAAVGEQLGQASEEDGESEDLRHP